MLKRRGISIPQSSDVRAFGETVMYCVPGFAANFHRAFQLEKPISIDLHYSNTGVRAGEPLLKEAFRLAIVAPDIRETIREQYGDILRVDAAVPGMTTQE